MFRSLKTKMIVPIVGLLILMIVFIVVFVSISAVNLANDITQERILGAAGTAEAQLSILEDQTRVVALAIAGNYTVISNLLNWNAGLDRAGSRQALVEYLSAVGRDMGVSSFVVRDAEGIVVLRMHALDNYGNREDSPAALAAFRGETTTSYSSTGTMPLGLNTTTPIWHGGERIGTMTPLFFLHTEEFVDRYAQILNAEVSILGGSTRVATTILTDEGVRAVGIETDEHITEAVLVQGQSLTTEQTLFGVPYFSYYFPLRGLAGNTVGMFSVAFSNAQTLSATAALQRSLLIIGAVSLVLITLVMLFFILKILKPIGLLKHTLDDSAKGDLTKRLPEQGRDEIASASRSFNMTMDEIRKMITAIKQQSGTLSGIGSDLASNMTETAAAMNQISANIQSIKGRVINQSASVTETNATMEQVTVNIDKLNDMVELQTGAVSQSSSAIEEMIANIQSVNTTLAKNSANMRELQESAETGKVSLQEVVLDIQEISRESEGLLEINSVMESISSQTNLLSMNAAIEAAHAGESGKGFAVVAAEIRKLAESSSEQSKTIGNVLKKIKSSIDKITSSTDKVLNGFEEITKKVTTVAEQGEALRNAMEEQGQGSKQILQSSDQVNEITQQVKIGSAKMLEGSKEVITESRNLEKVTQEITNGINEMVIGADQVNNTVNNVNELSGKTKENILTLVDAVSRFKV